tara:strand:+ start:530 stop:1075 length:546 start_codon:yes stop_codon:yes gene_type:complete
MKSVKLFVFLSILYSNLVFASIEITTIDSWRIVNVGSHTLLVNKFSEDPDSQNGFLFQMSRPHCLCEEPTFVMYSPDIEGFKRPEEDTRLRGELRVDFQEWRDVELEIFLAREDSKQNIIRLRGTFPSLRDAKVIELNSIYGADKWILKNIDHAMRQATKLCESFIPYEKEQVKETKGKKV